MFYPACQASITALANAKVSKCMAKMLVQALSRTILMVERSPSRSSLRHRQGSRAVGDRTGYNLAVAAARPTSQGSELPATPIIPALPRSMTRKTRSWKVNIPLENSMHTQRVNLTSIYQYLSWWTFKFHKMIMLDNSLTCLHL